jgi:hypothetical protein
MDTVYETKLSDVPVPDSEHYHHNHLVVLDRSPVQGLGHNSFTWALLPFRRMLFKQALLRTDSHTFVCNVTLDCITAVCAMTALVHNYCESIQPRSLHRS